MEDDSEEADKKVEAALLKGLDKYKSSNPEIVSTSKIGSTVADDIRQTAQVSVIISLIGIFLYILVRFRRWQYGAGAVISLVHNALIVFSGFAVANLLGIPFEIDQVFVAAMLTVIGYTINDTVVVFDRIREFENNYTKENFATSLNDAINATLARCIITSLTTLVVVLALLLLGGDALRGFAFALFIGIIFGTYASLFIASPIVYELSKKEKDTAVTA
jgi:SecD/SecF fusion protein